MKITVVEWLQVDVLINSQYIPIIRYQSTISQIVMDFLKYRTTNVPESRILTFIVRFECRLGCLYTRTVFLGCWNITSKFSELVFLSVICI